MPLSRACISLAGLLTTTRVASDKNRFLRFLRKLAQRSAEKARAGQRSKTLRADHAPGELAKGSFCVCGEHV